LRRLPTSSTSAFFATGYNVVDTQAAKEKGIPVCNIPTYGTDAVAQFAFALLLEIAHHVQHHSDAVKQGRWTSCPDFCFWDYPLIELAGKTMGLIGYGRIGQAVARIARAFGMVVIAYDSYQTRSIRMSMYRWTNCCREAIFVSLHCPLFEATKESSTKRPLHR
jgi:glycerate dehydrogenase